MTNDKTDDGSQEVEIRFDDSSQLELQRVSVDAQDEPISFCVSGVIHDVNEDLLATLAGKRVTPVAVSVRATETEV